MQIYRPGQALWLLLYDTDAIFDSRPFTPLSVADQHLVSRCASSDSAENTALISFLRRCDDSLTVTIPIHSLPPACCLVV